jgi:hypothetical protein
VFQLVENAQINPEQVLMLLQRNVLLIPAQPMEIHHGKL